MSAISTATYGLFNASARFNQAATQTVQDSANIGSGSGDIVSDFVGQMEARTAFEANISVIKTADQMTGRLLNITA